MSNTDYVFKEGPAGALELVGDFEGLYQNVPDPWEQSAPLCGAGDMSQYYLHSRTRLASVVRSYSRGREVAGLEIGCGHGHVVNTLRQVTEHIAYPSTWTGMDISETAIAKARVLHPNCKFLVGDIQKRLPVDFGVFDIVVLGQILWYVLPKFRDVVYNCYRILKPGGLLVISQAYLRDQRYGKDIINGFGGAVLYFLTRHGSRFKLVEATLDDTRKYVHDDGILVFRRTA